MVAASRPQVCISVARSTLAVWRTMRGGMGARMSEDTSPLDHVCGSGAACSHSLAAGHTGGRGPPRGSWLAAAGCAAPTPRAGWRRTSVRGTSSPTIRASHAVMEPRLMIHRGKRASCRCFEKPPCRSRYGFGSSCGGHSRVPFTTRREAQKSLPGRGGGGGAAALCRGETSVHPGRCAWGLREELLQPVIAPMRNSPSGACGGGNRPPRSLAAGQSGLWLGAAPLPPRAPAQGRRRLSMRRPRSATRPRIDPCPRAGGGRPPLALPGGSGARGAVSGRTQRVCTEVSSGPTQRMHGCGRMAMAESRSFRTQSLRCTGVWPSLARSPWWLVAVAVSSRAGTWAVVWAAPRGVCLRCVSAWSVCAPCAIAPSVRIVQGRKWR